MTAAARNVDLTRRLAHWLMKEPDLEEEALRAEAHGRDVTIERQTLKDDDRAGDGDGALWRAARGDARARARRACGAHSSTRRRWACGASRATG